MTDTDDPQDSKICSVKSGRALYHELQHPKSKPPASPGLRAGAEAYAARSGRKAWEDN